MNQNFVETDLAVQSAPLDPQFRGTLQQAFDQYTERLRIVTPYGLLRVVVSDVAPTSNVGLWLKDGTKPYVWDEVSSVYVPLDISDSLSYDYDTLVAIILANFNPADNYLLSNRINRTDMIADKTITAAKLAQPFGPGHAVPATNAAGTTYFVTLAPGQFVQANPTTGEIEAGNKDPKDSFAAQWPLYNYRTLEAGYKPLPAAGAVVLFNHGLTDGTNPVTPGTYQLKIVCVDNAGDASYAKGDEIDWTNVYINAGSLQAYATTYANATYVGAIRNGPSLTSLYVDPKDGIGAGMLITESSWRLKASATR